jgi:hypothetical protein
MDYLKPNELRKLADQLEKQVKAAENFVKIVNDNRSK